MLYVFDLDGTLIDNYDAVLQSYRDAGVEPPDDFFITPSSNWPRPPTKEQKERKQKCYLLNMHLCKAGPALALWRSLNVDAKMIITGASHAASQTSLSVLGISSTYVTCEQSIAQKVHLLKTLQGFHSSMGGGVAYVDADQKVCSYISSRAGVTGLTFV